MIEIIARYTDLSVAKKKNLHIILACGVEDFKLMFNPMSSVT